MKWLRRIIGMTRRDGVRNEVMRQELKLKLLVKKVQTATQVVWTFDEDE